MGMRDDDPMVYALFSKDAMSKLVKLSFRWDNEKEYEDWSDYTTVMQDLINSLEGFAFVKMLKRPFGVRFTFNGETYFLGVENTPQGKAVYVEQ